VTTRYTIPALVVCLATVPAGAQGKNASQANASFVPAPTAGNGLHLENGLPIPAVLVTPLDAKRNKRGSVVVAKTTQDIAKDGEVVLKKGSELRGHVTQVQRHTSETPDSRIAFIFDQVVAKGGHDLVPMNFSIEWFCVGTPDSESTAPRKEKVITASGENVQLSAGTPMILQVAE
jgi:hypothetical protein